MTTDSHSSSLGLPTVLVPYKAEFHEGCRQAIDGVIGNLGSDEQAEFLAQLSNRGFGHWVRHLPIVAPFDGPRPSQQMAVSYVKHLRPEFTNAVIEPGVAGVFQGFGRRLTSCPSGDRGTENAARYAGSAADQCALNCWVADPHAQQRAGREPEHGCHAHNQNHAPFPHAVIVAGQIDRD